MKDNLTGPTNLSPVVLEIKSVLEKARNKVATQINSELLISYWKIGEIIVRYEQDNNIRAAYGEQTLKQMSKILTKELGKGFSVSNMQFMRRFYQTYEIQQTASVKLSWSHYCELLIISDPDKRSFYEKEAVNSGWSVRELKRQIASSLFERLLLSRDDVNKKQVLALAQKGIEIAKPEDIIRDKRHRSKIYTCRCFSGLYGFNGFRLKFVKMHSRSVGLYKNTNSDIL